MIKKLARFCANRRFRRAAVVVGPIALMVCAIGLYYGLWRFHLKRFDVVAPGVLYRSAQPSEWGMDHLIRYHGVKTVVNLRRDEGQLKTLLDISESERPYEAAHVRNLGGNFLHWRLGGEAYWPWLSPEYFEDFFTLFDRPENLPVAVHCVGGRHRTGTVAALYRLEYDRWPVTQVLEEMYTYEFGEPVAIHEHNLRTYRPRPRPSQSVWKQLAAAFAPVQPVDDYEALVRRLREQRHTEDMAVLESLLKQDGAFAVCLAERVIDSADHCLVPHALDRAMATLEAVDASPQSLASAAALIADWAEPARQQQLLVLLEDQPRDSSPSPRYEAIVNGVTNRYSANRLPYLVPLLADQRYRPEPDAAQYRYCDTAAARLVSITNEPLIETIIVDRADWDSLVAAARDYIENAPELCRLRRFDRSLFERYHRAMGEVEDKDDYRS